MQLRYILKRTQPLHITSFEPRLRHEVAILDLHLRWDLSVIPYLMISQELIRLNRRRQWGVSS